MAYSENAMEVITLTEVAASKITELLAEETDASLKVRCFVQGGGCSGFSYGFTLDSSQNEDDYVIEQHSVSLLIDSMSIQYLVGATIDYKEDLSGSQFVIQNPNAQSTCGCGSSFSV